MDESVPRGSPYGRAPSAFRLIDVAARSVGQDPAAVRRIYNVVGSIGSEGRSGLVGDAAVWVETLTEWAIELGFDTFIFWPTLAPLSQVETLTNDVIPGVRARVSERRAALTGVGGR